MSAGTTLLGVAAFASAPLMAQPNFQDSTSRVRPQWIDVHADIRKVLSDFGICTVRFDPKRSREIVLSSSYLIDDYYSDLFSDFCIPMTDRTLALSMTPTVVRFALADAIFARELKGSDPRAVASVPPLPSSNSFANGQDSSRSHLNRDAQAKLANQVARDLRYFHFGECVVRADPIGAKALLLTKIETDGEASAFVSLLPVLNQCQEGSTETSFDKADIRGVVAVNYVRLAYAARRLTGAHQ
jgi:hypothetical protein